MFHTMAATSAYYTSTESAGLQHCETIAAMLCKDMKFGISGQASDLPLEAQMRAMPCLAQLSDHNAWRLQFQSPVSILLPDPFNAIIARRMVAGPRTSSDAPRLYCQVCYANGVQNLGSGLQDLRW